MTKEDLIRETRDLVPEIRARMRAWYDDADLTAMPAWQLELLDAASWRVTQKLARRARERKQLAQQGGCN
jgi:hypothetical protein